MAPNVSDWLVFWVGVSEDYGSVSFVATSRTLKLLTPKISVFVIVQKRTYAYTLLKNFGLSSLLSAIIKKFGLLDILLRT